VRLVVGGDHAGLEMKGTIVHYLEALGHEVTDVGTHSPEPVDFPDIAATVCGAVRAGRADRGVMVCGTGVGAAIAANKTPGIRASVIHDIYSARQCVEHDDVNVACIGAQIIGVAVAKDVLAAFLRATFSTDEHFRRRVQKLHDLERASARELSGE
jgi:ribose 5-phosphate isomerase B